MATVPTNVPAGKTIQLSSLGIPTNVPAGTTVGLTNTAPKVNVPTNVPAGMTVNTGTPYNVPAGQTASMINGNGTTGSWNSNGSYTLAAAGYNPSQSSGGGGYGAPSYSAPSQQSSTPSLSSLMNTATAQSTPATPAQTGQATMGNGGTLGGILGNGYGSIYDEYKNATAPTDYSSLNPLQNDLTEAKKAYEMEKESMRAARSTLDKNSVASPVTSQFYNASAGAVDRNYGARLSNASSLQSTLEQDLLSRVAMLDKSREQRIQQAKAGIESFKAMNPDETFTAYGNNPAYTEWQKQQTLAKQNPLDALYKQAQIANIQDQINNRGYSWRTDPLTGQSYQVRNAGDIGGGALGGGTLGGYSGGSASQSQSIARAAGSAPSNLQPYLNALKENPSLYGTWSQNVRQAITPYLQSAGVNLQQLNMDDLSATQEDSVSAINSVLNFSNGVLGDMTKNGTNLGPWASTAGNLAKTFGLASADYTKLTSDLANISQMVRQARSGLAITESEAAALAPYLPDPAQKEDETTVRQKLGNLITTLNQIKEDRVRTGVQRGYQQVQSLGQQPQQQPSGQVGYLNGVKYVNNGNGWVKAQ